MRLPQISLKWLCAGVILLLAALLHQIPRKMEVTLHLLTDRISMTLPETGDAIPISLVESLPVTTLHVSGSVSVPLEVQEIRESGKLLVVSKNSVRIKAMDEREARIDFRGPSLRLMHVKVAPGTDVELETDQRHNVVMQVRHSRMNQVQLTAIGHYTLAVQDVELLDPHGKVIPWGTSQPVHSLEITPTVPSITFEQEQVPLVLVMNFSQQRKQENSWSIPLGFRPRLRVSHLDFTQEVENRRVSAIKHLWIAPIIPAAQAENKIYLEIPEYDIFVLQSLHLSEKGLETELAGRTATLMMGQIKPFTNRMPSWLSSLQYNEPFVTILTLLKAIIT